MPLLLRRDVGREGTGEMSDLYDVILADPPWHFQNYGADEPGMIHERGRGANAHYPTMTVDQIGALSVPAADNAVLLLWACWPLLPESMQVITDWGFTYKSLAWVWVKANPSGMGHHMGMGYWTRANSEPCFLATRGKGLKRQAMDVLSLIYAPVQEHSRKPDGQYGKIERLFPGARCLEMFARRQRPGWDVFGNQVDNSIEIEAVAK